MGQLGLSARRALVVLVVAGMAAAVALVSAMPAAARMTWTMQTSPNPGSPDNYLGAVSCASDTLCIAVGDYDTGPAMTAGLIEQWNGMSWSVASSPQPSVRAGLAGVSCSSSAFCMAVGTYRLSNGAPLAYAEQWNGTAWTLTSAIAPANSGFNGVSCVTAGFCVAVGYENASNGLIETWNGSSWQIAATPGTAMHGVSCPETTFCMAVGSSSGSTAQAQYNGSTWSATVIPIASNAQLYGVSCPFAVSCMAVGGQNAGSQPLAEEWKLGSGWSSTTVPSSGGLDAISCVTSSDCAAAGDTTTSAGANALVDSWDGTAWTQEPAQSPNAENDLYGASCTSGGVCVVVGQQFPADGSYGDTLIEVGLEPAIHEIWKQKDVQAAKNDIRAALPQAVMVCTPHALGLAGLTAGVLLSSLPGGTIVLTTSAGVILAAYNGPCAQVVERIVLDYLRITHDPPDQNYDVVVNPAPIAPVRLQSCKRWHGTVRRFCNQLSKTARNWAQDAERVVSIDQALVTTRNRESTAIAAFDQAAVTLQDDHIPVLEHQMTAALAAESADERMIARLLRTHHIAYRMTKLQSRKVIAALLKVLGRQGITNAQLSSFAPGVFKPRAINILAGLSRG